MPNANVIFNNDIEEKKKDKSYDGIRYGKTRVWDWIIVLVKERKKQLLGKKKKRNDKNKLLRYFSKKCRRSLKTMMK